MASAYTEGLRGSFPSVQSQSDYTANSKTIAWKWRIQERKDKVRPVGHSKNVVFDSNLVSH